MSIQGGMQGCFSFKRGAVALAAALVFSIGGPVAAQETERIGSQEEDLRPNGSAGGVVPTEVVTTETAEAEAALDFVRSSSGGVPAEAMPADIAVDTVSESFDRFATESEGGIPGDYALTFGDTSDWIQLVSGEWLKGTIKRMRDDSLEFDSDEIGIVFIDFADIIRMQSPNVNTYVFDERESATGLALITADSVVVETGAGTQTFPRAELEGIVSGGEREKDWWSMSLRFGLTLNRGNTDQLTYDTFFRVRREDRMTLLDLTYNATFGRTNGTQNVNRHLGEFDFKVFLSDRWFVAPLFGQLLNDRFQNIRFRATPAAGAGVHIIDRPKVVWDFQTGLGYQYLKYKDGSAAQDGNPQHDAFIPLYTYADFDITGDIDFTVSWLTNLVVTNIGNTNHTGRADLAMDITDVLAVSVSFLFLRTEQPGPPPASDLPPLEKNDYQLVFGIALDLG